MADASVDVVLLPGLDGTGMLFEPLVAALPPWVRTTVVSYPPTGPTTYADLLPRVRDAVASRQNVFILGWSFSGPLALQAASEAPPGLRGVILCASFVRAPWPVIGTFGFMAVAPLFALVPTISQTKALLGGYSSREFRREMRAVWSQVPSTTLAARVREVLLADARAALAACPAPVLYLAGTRDFVVPRRNVADVLRYAPSTCVTTIDGPHLAMMTNPVAAAAAVVDFIRQQKSA